MKHIYVVLFFLSVTAFGQENWEDFSGKEKAFFYHTARRIEPLKTELFHLFEFRDSIPYINDTLPDYSYIEREVVKNPFVLDLFMDQLDRKSDGLVANLALRYALWELGQVLQYRNSTAEEDKSLKEKLKRFEKYVLEETPQSAVKTLNNGDYVLAKTLQGYYSPSLTVSDKMAGIVNAGYPQLDQMLILNSIMAAQEKYVHERSQEIFKALGGNPEGNQNHISAVGDGSNWAEIIGGIDTPYDVGLPDENNLFKFKVEQISDNEKKKSDLKVKVVESLQFKTNREMETVVHVDVFGYHPERQTTIAIQKGGNSYVLYGKNEHRLVSPDSSYGEGTTYWRLMNNLEFYHIANLKEDLYGKRGYEYQIDLYEEKIEKTKLQIKKTEYRLDILRHTPEGPPKIKKKKKVKKKNLGYSDQAGKGHPTSALSKLDKKKNIEQNRLLQLNSQLDGQKAILEQLKIDMEQAYIKLVKYEARLDFMKKSIGYIVLDYEVDNYIYTFNDGATFNYLTQDFTFPAEERDEAFQVYHISFGKEVFTENIDENFVHFNISNQTTTEKYALQRIVRDNEKNVITKQDSIQIDELFRHLLKKETKPTLTVKAGGILGESHGMQYRDSVLVADPYNADVSRGIGLIKYKTTLSSTLDLSLIVFEHQMIPKGFENYRGAFEKIKRKNPTLNEIDFYTGIRAKKTANLWVSELERLANSWIKDTGDRQMIIKKLNKLKVKKIVFLNGKLEAKVPNLE